MKKAYSLDYSIQRDTDRVAAVAQILDELPIDPSPTELEQMASYILYGKDEEGYNSVQRGETTDGNKRYSSFKKKDDQLLSLDEILDNPIADHDFRPDPGQYLKKKPAIAKPKYDRKTGQLIDPGDSDIPFMTDLWDTIARWEHRIAILEGKVPLDEDSGETPVQADSYKLYKMRHALIDIRRHQYYLKDAYKPTLHFMNIDRPKAQFIDWTSDSFYWVNRAQLEKKLAAALTHHVNQDINSYETRINPQTGEVEYKWVVCEHTFDWENPLHVRALLNVYDLLYQQVYEKLDTYSRTLIFDLERYRKMANFTPIRSFLLDCKLEHINYTQILALLQQKFNITYNENHLCTILSREIPERISFAAKRYRLLCETPKDQCKVCFTCKQVLPRNTIFFSHNRSRKDGFSSNCKECEKRRRIEKGGQATYDQRSKESTMLTMSPRET